MKIFENHDKMRVHYGAVERTKKRYVTLFALIGIILIGLSIYFFIIKNTIYGILVLIVSFVMAVLTVQKVVVIYIIPKKNKLYGELYKQYEENKIKRELSSRGLKLDYIDIVLDPNGFIKIGYYYNKNVYYLANVSLLDYGFALDLMKDMFYIDAKIFDKNLPKKCYKQFKVTKTKDKNLSDFYDDFAAYIKNSNDLVEELNSRCKKALEENKN